MIRIPAARLLAAAFLALSVSACGGGGGSSSPATPAAVAPVAPAPPVMQALTNLTTITVDQGPAALQVGPGGYIADDTPFVTLTICPPNSSINCQQIDHVEVDTGSTGLRLLQSAISPALLPLLSNQTDASGTPVGECYGYVDGYVFGSVRQADLGIGGEKVVNMPLQVIGDGGAFAAVPASCSAGGGSNLNTVQAFGANGVLGIGLQTTDCGQACAGGASGGAATYYACPATGCAAITARAPLTTAPFQQLPNPVAAMSVDNNGTIMSLPAVPATGLASVSGTLFFGIGTQTNNALGSASVIPTTAGGFVNANYKGVALPNSYIDSGTNFYVFTDPTLPGCTGKTLKGYYCPTPSTTVSVTVNGPTGAASDASFTLFNAQPLLTGSQSALPGIGGDPTQFSNLMDYPKSFAFGLPFFFGRNIYTAIQGRAVGSLTGPFFAY